MAEERKRHRGDRRDARLVHDQTGLNVIEAHIMPNRTDAEVFMQQDFDITELLKYMEKKNAEHPNYKTTVFHCLVFAVAKMIYERPKMNRFVQGRRTYERYDISMSFMAKRRFADGAEESFMTIIPKEGDTLDSISHKIYGDVQEVRKSATSTGGLDQTVNDLAKLPRLLLMIIGRIVRWLDFWGKVPKALSDGDSNFSTCLLSNLGSIKCPSIYHHLNNYGSNCFVVTIGTMHKAELIMPDGTKQIRDVVDISATVDERIADGFYFARSLNVVKYLFAHPEIMDQPFETPTGYDYGG